MKLLITGAKGQLGTEVVRMARSEGLEVIAVDREAFDFLNPERVAEQVSSARAKWVINCAAYTQVDRAEEEADQAFVINRDAAQAVAQGVHSYGGRLLHISTDFIFDGRRNEPYDEANSGNPLSVYGQSKWEGEIAVLRVLSDAIILRTAWIYGNYGNNFVKTMLRLAAERSEMRVVDDQIGTPAWTWDIAAAILAMMKRDAKGIYHFTDEGVASWYDLAQATVDIARGLGYPIKVERISPIPSLDYPTPAQRPAYSVLSKRKIRELLGYDIPHWRESVGFGESRVVGTQRAIHLIGRDVQKARGGVIPPMPTGHLQEVEGAQYVGLDKRFRAGDRAIDV